MDDALAPRLECYSDRIRNVLILVVMDDALALDGGDKLIVFCFLSLNPCCNG